MTEEKITERQRVTTEGPEPRQSIGMTYEQGAEPHGDEAAGGALAGGVARAALGAVVGGAIGAASGTAAIPELGP